MVAGEPSDLELLDAWSAGSQSSGDALARRHYARIHRFFEMKAPHMADDLTQRTFLGCVEHRARWRRESSFRAYLFGIARKQLLRYLESPRRLDAMRNFDEVSGGIASPSSIVARRDEQRMLLLALDALPVDLQIAVQLFYWEALNTTEIGEVLGISVSAVTTRLSRARRRIREHVVEMNRPSATRDLLVADIDTWTRSLVEHGPKLRVPPIRPPQT
ncbi:MAG: sigma-70 family RNA polymerase sigma factor [Nannocystaceae bacterium]|nr:sigma-70 family RNA polymerase sigma factor [Nannocystaceae bacterium]